VVRQQRLVRVRVLAGMHPRWHHVRLPGPARGVEEVRRRLLGLLLLLLLLELLRMEKVRREEGLRVGMKLVRMRVHERSVLLLLLVRRRQLVLARGVAFPRISRRLQQIEKRRAGCVAAVWVLWHGIRQHISILCTLQQQLQQCTYP
jgi:hypothetical protein